MSNRMGRIRGGKPHRMGGRFRDLPAQQKAAACAHICHHLNERAKEAGETFVAVSEPTRKWVERLRLAMVDDATTEAGFEALDKEFCDYLETIPQPEARQARRYHLRFAQVLANMPADATKCSDWFDHVRRHGSRDLDL